MQTSGLLIHVDASGMLSRVEELLRSRTDLILGERTGGYWPVVLEASSERGSKDAVRALERVDGIGRVDVVFISTDESTGEME